jgi:hypothetical protein
VPFAARAVLQASQGASHSNFVNFSERGCFVQTSRPLPIGTQVRLSFGVADLAFRCMAIVRHRKVKGLGLEFVQVDPATQAAFRTLVELNP